MRKVQKFFPAEIFAEGERIFGRPRVREYINGYANLEELAKSDFDSSRIGVYRLVRIVNFRRTVHLGRTRKARKTGN